MPPLDELNNAVENSRSKLEARFYATPSDLADIVQSRNFNRSLNEDDDLFIGHYLSEHGRIEVWLDNSTDESYYETP